MKEGAENVQTKLQAKAESVGFKGHGADSNRRKEYKQAFINNGLF